MKKIIIGAFALAFAFTSAARADVAISGFFQQIIGLGDDTTGGITHEFDRINFSASTTTSGNSFTINGGLWVEDLYVSVFTAVYTVSQSLAGYGEFSSNDFGNSLPLKVPMQPGAAALGATGTQGIMKLAAYHNTHMPMKTSCKITTAFTNDINQTGTTSFILGVGYTKQ